VQGHPTLGIKIFSRIRKTVDALGFRLGLAVGVSVMFACLLVTTGGMMRTAEQQYDARAAEIQTYANVLASGVANALAEDDIAEMTRTLNAIAPAKGIEFAAVYDTMGRTIAGIGMQAVLVSRKPETTARGSLSALFSTQTIAVESPIRKSGRVIGSLRIAGELPGAGAAFMGELRNAALWAALALLIGMVVGLIFQRQIVRPLERLTRTISEAGAGKQLPKRFSFIGKGEIGVLAGAYNHMIDEITSRESELDTYRQHLEELVDVRTTELRSARDEAQAATEAKSRFLATMSHEIRTPMNGLLVMAELLERSNLPASEARHAGTIARSGRSLMHLLNDIMDFSKLEAGKIELEAIPLSLDDVVGDCVGLFWEQARTKGVEIVPYIAPDVPSLLNGDPTRIGQCLSNLVGNAIKFTETGHVGIEITTDAQGAIRIAVSDTGVGIPQDRLESVFEAFSQADQSTTRSHGGTGLGLNICVQLVEAMEGTIDVTSTLGEGSCFTMCLPLETAQAREPAGPMPVALAVRSAHPALAAMLERALTARGIVLDGQAEAVLVDAQDATDPDTDTPHIGLWRLESDLPETALGQGWLDDLLRVPCQRDDLDHLLVRIAEKRFQGLDLLRRDAPVEDGPAIEGLTTLRVLVADDSAVNLEVMSEALEIYGIIPQIAHDGAEALDMLNETPFDIAFVDGDMPRLDGFEVAKRTRAAGIDTRLVLFSAHSRSTLASYAADSGFDDTLTKPFPLDALKALLLSAAGIEDMPAQEEPTAEAPAPSVRSDSIFDGDSLDALRALDARRPGAMQRVLDRFVQTLPDAVTRLTDALHTDDDETIRTAAHALKSMCFSVGAAQLSRTVETLEKCARGEIAIPPDWVCNHDMRIQRVTDQANALTHAVETLPMQRAS